MPANDAPPWEYEGGAWNFYDTVELVRAMSDSLDGADGASGEKELKKAMRETLPLLTTDMAEKQVVNLDEGWRDEGHDYLGQPVLRSFKEAGVETWSTTGRVSDTARTLRGAQPHVAHPLRPPQVDGEDCALAAAGRREPERPLPRGAR